MGLFGTDYQNVDSTAPPLASATAIPVGKVTTEGHSSSPGGIEFGRQPMFIGTCPHCQHSGVTTRIKTYPVFETWLACGLLLLVFWPVCWVPLVTDTCKKTEHVCTQCEEMIGDVSPLSDCCVKRMG
eukprot:CCRYP_011283-RA/>CCRYP_011283-RA protein AED:0.15 eAED:0.15 QI:219/1/1/1/0.5/0.66/3/232/126